MKIKTYTEAEWKSHCSNYPAVNNEELTVVYDGDWICSDLCTKCKKSKTAITRFLDALETVRPGVKNAWFDEMVFQYRNLDGTGAYVHQDGAHYHFGIEDQDGAYYIFLNEKEV